jgi:hypothetical protein
MRNMLVSLILFSAVAAAQETTPPDVERGERYDGRKVRTWPKKAALAVPRAILGVPRLVFLGLSAVAKPTMEYAERHHIPERVLAAITSPDGKEGVRPVLDYELAFRPSFGVLYFNDRIRDGGRFTVSLATGGPDTIITGAHATVPLLHERLRLDAGIDYRRRSDELFTGIGMPQHAHFSRYGIDQVDGTVVLVAHPIRPLTISIGEDVGMRRYNPGAPYGGDPDIDDIFCVRDKQGACVAGGIDEAAVPGFAAGTQLTRETLAVHIDSRRQETSPGLIVDAAIAYTHGFGSDASSYLRLHGRVGTQLEVWRRRSIYVGVTVDDELALGATSIPFTELVTLGGPDDLRGFARGRFRGASSMIATVEWRWPVWMWMDGSVFFDYGGVFGPGFRDFSVGALRPDVGIGFRVHTDNKYVMRIQAAWGFGDAGGFRLVIAGNGNPS